MSESAAARLAAIRAQLPPACNLLAVSKGQPAAAIRELSELGQHSFGESRLQEATSKQAELVERAMDAALRGCLPRCPRCRQGFLRPRRDDPALLECPGWFDESRGRSGARAECGYTLDGREPGARPPWRWR